MDAELSALRAENQALRARLRRVLLETAVHDEDGGMVPLSTLAQHLECSFYSDALVLAVIHPQPNPMHRHTAPAPPPVGQSMESIVYFPVETLALAEALCASHFSPQTHCLLFRSDRGIGILLNPKAHYVTETSLQSGDYLAAVKSRFSALLTELDCQLGFPSTAALSALWREKINLRNMYLETRYTYEYSWNCTGNVHTYGDLCSAPLTAEERMELSAWEQEFMNDISRTYFFEASLVLDSILQKQFLHAVPLAEVTVAVTARLRNVLAVVEFTGGGQILAVLSGLLQKVAASVSVPELQDRIHDFFASLADFAPRQTARKGTLVLEFVEANYQNPSLSAQMICDRFRISHAYLSRLVRQETGQTLVDCIHAFRLRRAKTLLAETALGIEEIAFEVGFSSRYSLIRSFRVYEGTTPSAYRTAVRGDAQRESAP